MLGAGQAFDVLLSLNRQESAEPGYKAQHQHMDLNTSWMAQLQPQADRLQMKIKHGDVIGLGWAGPKLSKPSPLVIEPGIY